MDTFSLAGYSLKSTWKNACVYTYKIRDNIKFVRNCDRKFVASFSENKNVHESNGKSYIQMHVCIIVLCNNLKRQQGKSVAVISNEN